MTVIDFPKSIEFLIGPFEEYRVVIDGRCIPKMTCRQHADGRVDLVVDHRFCASFPNSETAYQAAVLAAQAMAIGAGYSHLGAETREMPFASQIAQLGADR